MLLFVLILEQGAESLAAGLGRSFSSFSSVRRPFTLSGRLTCLAYTDTQSLNVLAVAVLHWKVP